MMNPNTDLLKALVRNAYEKNKIDKCQYELFLKNLSDREEEIRLQNKLKEYKKREVLKKYNDLILS